MEERIPQPEPREETQAPIVAEPEPPAATPCDDDDAVAPAVQLLSSSSGEGSSSDDDEGDLEFEFPFVSRDSPAGTAAPADELFADGRIRTFYPVFGRGVGCSSSSNGGFTGRPPAAPGAEPRVMRGQLGRLFLEETRDRNSSTSSTSSSTSSSLSVTATDDDGLEGAAPESYCVWRPGSSASASASPSPRPTPPRKSGSTGSMARWRRISDLVVGRSHSDGREKFVFLAAAPPPARDAPKRSKKPSTASTAPSAGAFRKPPPPVAAAEADAGAAHRVAYLARGGPGGVPLPPGGTPRRTFLPYREELVGFFANVNGISRSHHHPF